MNKRFLPERDYATFRYLTLQFRLSSVCLSVVGNVRAPYSVSWNFWQYLYGILLPTHSVSVKQNFTKIGGETQRGSQI